MTVDKEIFKQAMSQFATGVTVVTTRDGKQTVGIVASAFCSVSLHPPQVLVCIAKARYTHELILRSRHYAVNILGTSQLEWGYRFAGLRPEIQDRFYDIDYEIAVTGCPILPGSIGWLDCRLHHIYDGGDHSILVGLVLAADSSDHDTPLLYHDQQWTEVSLNPDLPTDEVKASS